MTGGTILKKKFTILLLTACLLTACGNKGVITTGEKPLSNAAYDTDYVSLAPYTGLKAEKQIYKVTDEAVNKAMKERLREFAEYKSVNRKSKTGDSVYADYSISIDGSEVEKESDYYFTIGEEEFGTAFDKKITGVSTGEKLDFSIAYEPDDASSQWAGQTVDFHIEVTDIQEELLPDADDAFVKENMEYDSYQAFKDATRQSVADRYEMKSTETLQEDLLKQVIDSSHIIQYTNDQYESAKTEVENAYRSYAELFGTDLDSIYEQLDMTDEDIESDIQATLARTLIVNTIIEKEQFSLSDADYEAGIAYYMKKNDYESKDDFMKDYGEEEIRQQLLEDQVLNYLVAKAEITEVSAAYTED